MGETGDHVRDGAFGRPVDLAVARDDVYRALAFPARLHASTVLTWDQSPTVAEHLRARGYATAGFVSNVRICNRVYGVGRGFDTYVDYPCNHEVSVRAALNSCSLGASLVEVASRAKLPVPRPFPLNLKPDAREITVEDGNGLTMLIGVTRAWAPARRGPFFFFST